MPNNASIRLLNHQDLQKSFVVDDGKKLLLDYIMPSELAALSNLAQAVAEKLSGEGTLAFHVNLCLEELITNVIKYGLASANQHFIQVQIYRHQKFLEIFLKDDAPQFDPFSDAPSPDIHLDIEHRPIGGLGIHFVKSIMDKAKAYYDGSGNLVVLLKNL
jgi:anti-sigma regulatory factor (Ser/Thr protein kinase)